MAALARRTGSPAVAGTLNRIGRPGGVGPGHAGDGIHQRMDGPVPSGQ
jgi:hypothetical protein